MRFVRGIVPTVTFDGAVLTLDYSAQMWPFGQVLEVEGHVVSFGERIEIGGGEAEDVHGLHRTNGRHLDDNVSDDRRDAHHSLISHGQSSGLQIKVDD